MTIATTPVPAPDALQRRVKDMPPAAQRLDWEDDGVPLPASSVVYLFRSREAGLPLWDENGEPWNLAAEQVEYERAQASTAGGRQEGGA